MTSDEPAAAAQAAAAKKDWSTAAAHWRRAIAACNGSAPVGFYAGLAQSLRLAGEVDAASKTVETALRQFSSDAQLYSEQAELFGRRKQWRESAACWAKTVELEAPSPAAHTLAKFARALRLDRRLEEADAVATDSLTRFPNHKPSLRESADIAMARERWQEAEQRWSRLIEISAGANIPATTFVSRATALQNLDRFEEAAAVLASGLEATPGDVALKNAAARLGLARRRSRGFGRLDRSGGAPGSDLSVERVCECFWETERKLDLATWRVNGVFVWPLIRMQVYYALMRNSGVYDAPHPGVTYHKGEATANAQAAEALNAIDSGRAGSGAHVDGPPQDALMMMTRKLGGVEPYTDALRRELDPTALLFDRASDGEIVDGAFDFDALVQGLRKRFRRLEDGVIGLRDLLICEELREQFMEALNFDIGDVARSCQDRIVEFLALKRGFDALWREYPIKRLFLTYGYGISTAAAVQSARDAGAHIVELQHGFISRFHLGYSWPGRPTVPYRPDELWTFGDYWSEVTPLPANMSARTIGAPYVKKLAESAAGDRQDNLVVFTSQGVIGARLLPFAIETARRRPDKEIVYRLHPSESLDGYQNQIAEAGSAPPNFSLSHRTPVIFELLARASVQVGAFSTTLIEGISLGTRAVVIDLPGVEYMRPVIERGDAALAKGAADLAHILDEAPLAADPTHYYAEPLDKLL